MKTEDQSNIALIKESDSPKEDESSSETEEAMMTNKELIIKILVLAIPSIPILLSFDIRNSITMAFLNKNYDNPDMFLGIDTARGFGQQTTEYFALGIVGALETIGANAYGAGKNRILGLNIHRALIISFAYSIVAVIVVQIFAEPFLMLQVAQNKNIYKYAIQYFRLGIFFIFPKLVYDTIHNYLNIVNKAYVAFICIFMALLPHPLWCYIFLVCLRWGPIGYAICSILSLCIEVLCLCIYLKLWNPAKGAIFWPNKLSFNLKGLWTFFKFSFPLACYDILFNVSFDIQSALRPKKVHKEDVFGDIASTINGYAESTTHAYSETTNILVGKMLTKNPKQTLKVIIFTIFIGLGTMVVVELILIVFRRYIIFCFVNTETEYKMTQKYLLFALGSEIFNLVKETLVGAMLGAGKFIYSIVFYIASFYTVNIGLSLFFVRYYNMFEIGFYYANTAFYIVFSIVIIIFFKYSSFEKLAKEAKDRIEQDRVNDELLLQEQEALLNRSIHT